MRTDPERWTWSYLLLVLPNIVNSALNASMIIKYVCLALLHLVAVVGKKQVVILAIPKLTWILWIYFWICYILKWNNEGNSYFDVWYLGPSALVLSDSSGVWYTDPVSVSHRVEKMSDYLFSPKAQENTSGTFAHLDQWSRRWPSIAIQFNFIAITR